MKRTLINMCLIWNHWFWRRDTQMRKVKFAQKWKTGSRLVNVGVPFVITYQVKLRKIAQIIKKLEHLLYQEESVKRVFAPPPIVAFQSAKKLSSYWIFAKLYTLEIKSSYKCCSSRCQVCSNIEEVDTFTNTITGESFKINLSLVKWLSVFLRIKSLWVQILLLSLKLQIWCRFRARSSLIFRQL